MELSKQKSVTITNGCQALARWISTLQTSPNRFFTRELSTACNFTLMQLKRSRSPRKMTRKTMEISVIWMTSLTKKICLKVFLRTWALMVGILS